MVEEMSNSYTGDQITLVVNGDEVEIRMSGIGHLLALSNWLISAKFTRKLDAYRLLNDNINGMLKVCVGQINYSKFLTNDWRISDVDESLITEIEELVSSFKTTHKDARSFDDLLALACYPYKAG